MYCVFVKLLNTGSCVAGRRHVLNRSGLRKNRAREEQTPRRRGSACGGEEGRETPEKREEEEEEEEERERDLRGWC